MKIELEINEVDLKNLIVKHLQEVLKADITPQDISIEVKSAQNYKAEWEPAKFRARLLKVSY